MPTLSVGARSYEVSEHRVRRQSERMFKMSAERRNHRLDRAKMQLARSAREADSENAAAAAKEAAAIMLSQGIDEIGRSRLQQELSAQTSPPPRQRIGERRLDE
jgi:hypothetical protein